MCVLVCVHLRVCHMEISISDSMQPSINDKQEIVGEICLFFFYRTCFAILHSIINDMCEKESLFLCYVVVFAKNVALVSHLT